MDVSQAPRSARRARRHTLVAALAAALLAAVLSPGAPVEAAHATYVRNPTFEHSTSGWKASRNATLSRVRLPHGSTAGQLRPRRAHGRTTVAMSSAASPDRTGATGTTVTVTASVRTSQPGRRIGLQVVELSGGKVVARRTTHIRLASKGWRRLGVTLRTTRPQSRIRILATAGSLAARQYVRVKAVRTDVTHPAPAVHAPAPPAGPVDTRACEEINYSRPSQGTLTFADEFNGTAIDRRTWRVRDDTYLDFDQALIQKENVSVHDGALDITGKKLPQDQWRVTPKSRYAWNQTRDYSTGYIDSIDTAGYGNAAGDRFGQKYGYFEIRALVPSTNTMSRGIWPAFWLRADHKNGEIDPMESYGAPTIRGFDPSASYEWNSWADTLQVASKDHTQGRAHPDLKNEPIWKAWHTYGVNWSPTCLRYTYDGTTVGTVPLSSKPYFTGDSFNDTFHIRLNMQIGSNYWGQADDAHTKPEFHYLVDWVHVYQGQGN